MITTTGHATRIPRPSPTPLDGRRIDGTRLGDEDTTYWFLYRALGWSAVLQLVWIIDGAVAEEDLDAMNGHLASGPLHRRLVRSRVPGARPRWEPGDERPPLCLDRHRVSDDAFDEWAAEEMAGVDLDPERGRCWRLRAVGTTEGNTVISLCALHLVADGRTLIAAAASAMADSSTATTEVAVDVGPSAASRGLRRRPGTDLADACAQVMAVGKGLRRAVSAVGRTDPATPQSDPRPRRAPVAERAPRAVWRRATVSVPTDEWDRVASSAGGTSNSLFVAVVTGLLRSSGYAPLGEAIKVGVPVDVRGDVGDRRSNATVGVSIMLTDDPVPGGDLRPIRAACKAAYTRLASGCRTAVAHLQPLVWLLPPSWLVPVVTAGSGMPDAMVSNVGELPDGILRLGSQVARRFAFRGMAQGVEPSMPHRFGDGVQSWLVRSSDQVTISVVGCDETSFESDEALRTLLGAEVAAWGLPHEIW
ncbi:hypothetical protein AAFP35_20280 [Gordonia sp. CPCC 206044]|uniref:hypothetical protein n=1 Tax=Gordonia sp. CPCC 206044 TaxID=3140793 RepID=UPI003AF3C0BF